MLRIVRCVSKREYFGSGVWANERSDFKFIIAIIIICFKSHVRRS